MSIFGAGLLVGTALTVIIPEGIRSLYSTCHDDEHEHQHHANVSEEPHHKHAASHSSNNETMIGLTLILGFIFMLIIDQVTHSLQHSGSAAGNSGGSSKFFFLEDFPKSRGFLRCC